MSHIASLLFLPRRARPFAFGAFCALVLMMAVVVDQIHASAPLVVTTTADGFGIGSLRDAIAQANSTASPCPAAGGCTITFSAAGTYAVNATFGPLTINTPNVVIDGTLATSSANTNSIGQSDIAVIGVQIDGGGSGDGLIFNAPGGGVRNVAMGGFNRAIVLQSTGATIAGNFIGTDTSGVTRRANITGVEITGTFGGGATNTIGGASDADRNVISGNTAYGVSAVSAANHNLITNNYVGPRATLAAVVDQNIGVRIDSSAGVGNQILTNLIYANRTMGIDLAGDSAPTPNDIGDPDLGGNGTQNFPVINSVGWTGAFLDINLSEDSASVPATQGFIFEVYKTDTSGQGLEFLGSSGCQSTSPAGVFNGHIYAAKGSTKLGDQIVLTATSYNFACTAVTDGTSEFSAKSTLTLRSGWVINTNDSGVGSLRQAILDVNAALPCPAPCEIGFSIPATDPGFSGGVFHIRPGSPLPAVTTPFVRIDGSEQTNFGGDTNPVGPEIEVNGSQAGATDGLVLQQIPAVSPFPNGGWISGLVINGFQGNGIVANGQALGGSDIEIFGNYIGVDATGTFAVPNTGNGIVFVGASANYYAIGTAYGQGNVISGNGGDGIFLDANSNNNRIYGNFIGTDRTGANPIPNGGQGVNVNSSGNRIGDPPIYFLGSLPRKIRPSSQAKKAMPAVVSPDGVNVIAYNGKTGVLVAGATSINNSILANSIFSNGGLGIDLNGDGVTLNDPLDGDVGPNNLQNYPVITANPVTGISGTLNSEPNMGYKIDFYSSPVADPSGYGEGKTWLGSTNVLTDALGNASFTFASAPVGSFVTATATGGSTGQSTSEFSAAALVAFSSDLGITKTHSPATVIAGGPISYTITVSNKGPDAVTGAPVVDIFPAAINAVTWTCTASAGSACSAASGTGNIGTTVNILAGGTATFVAGGTISLAATGVLVNTASTTAPLGAIDPNPSNNNATDNATISVGCTSPPTNPQPADGSNSVPPQGSLTWGDVGASSYNVFLGRAGNGCSTSVGNVKGTSFPYSLQGGTQYEWRVEAVSPTCTQTTACMRFTTAAACPPATPPQLISPLEGSTVSSPVTFSWTAVSGAIDYKVFASVGGAATSEVGTTSNTSLSADIGDGAVSWYVVAEFPSPCADVRSGTGTFTTCTAARPVPALVAEVSTNQTYTLEWKAIDGATKYEVDEALDKFFTQGLKTQTVNGTSVSFQYTVSVPTARFYRVRAFLACSNSFGPNSETMRVVLDLIPPPDTPNPNVNVPVGSKQTVMLIIHIPGVPDQTLPFTAQADQPWIVNIDPASGLLPPEGINVAVTIDPTNLPNGTQMATLIVTIGGGAGALRSNGVTTVSVPVSVSLVTPVSPVSRTTTPANSLIIPAAGHLDGINSRWQSDVRLANVAQDSARYQLIYTPDDIAMGVKQTIINADAGATVALDDIVRNWYGIGSLGEMANGILEIRPIDTAKGAIASDAVSVSLTTVASSRTYNVTSNGTLGQFIPAVPFANFIGRLVDPTQVASVLGLQQIAQNADYRTNFGVVEGAGSPVSLQVSVFDPAGTKLLDQPLDLKANGQRQLNGFLAQNKISLDDGRIEVKATGGDGKVTAYASVIDNHSGDPLLVPAVQLNQSLSNHYVLAGVADVTIVLSELPNSVPAWRTDMRLFNSGSTPQQATLTFYQQGGGTPKTATVTINPGQVTALNDVLRTTFATTNAGGAVHVTTAVPSSLVVTGRTYDQTSSGTFGQFIPAATAADAVGKADRALQILQVEDSVRYRTNVGVAEVTGKPATVEVSVALPNSKISPKTQFPLAANGFFQADVIQGFGLVNVYNARISVRVVDGDGKITAYGSVVDMKTQDPTFVPAQ